MVNKGLLVTVLLAGVCLGITGSAAKVVNTVTEPLDNEMQWKAWKTLYSKSYGGKYEEKQRYAIWLTNYQRVLEHNKAGHTFTLGMNQLADLTLTEYRFYMLGARYPGNATRSRGSTFLPPANVKLPSSVDWRNEGYVTPVKNQGECGSCWAFSSTGSLEGQHYKKTEDLVSLSEQNLVDCVTANQGCGGGWMDKAFTYVRNNGGIDTEVSYPYYARQLGYCYFNKDNVGATATGYVDVTKYSESALQVAVATVGPISIAIDASHPSFQMYRSGVYYEPQCSSIALDHAVLVVGYGTIDGQDYWLVKNSWGASWGIDGYVMMARNRNNHCGIATAASYPLV